MRYIDCSAVLSRLVTKPSESV